VVIWPNVLSITVVSRLLNCGWLRKSKNSARYSSLNRSPKLKVLCAEKSMLKVAGPINVLRPTLPKVLFAGVVKALVVNHIRVH